MIPHPTMIHAVSELRRRDLLATVERERCAATADDPALLPLPAVRVFTLAAMLLGLRV